MVLASIQSFLGHRRSILLALLLMSSLYFFSYFQRVAVPGTVFDELQREFSASAGAIAALSSIYLYLYGLLQIFIGMGADRWGGGRVLLGGGILLSLGAILFPLAHSISELYVARVLTGVGASCMFICVVKEIDSLFESRHFAIVLCITIMIGYSGGLFGTLPFNQLVARFGWRPALGLAGALCAGATLAAGLVLWRLGRLRGAPDPSANRLYFNDILRNRSSYPVLLAGAINFTLYFIWQAVFGKKMLMDACHFSAAGAAAVTGGMMLFGMGVTVASGFLSRLMGNRRKPILVICVLLTLFAVGTMLGSLAPGAGARRMLAASLVLGAASGASALFCCIMKELNPQRAAGTSVGFINSACYLAIAVAVNGMGAILDQFRSQAVSTATALIYPAAAYRLILLVCLILAGISLASVLFIRESRGVCVYPEQAPPG
jgi:predicted MFS family arabinose efflux permease